MSVQILIGDCRARMAELPDASVDSVVCDPPYELGFMGKTWDKSGIANDNTVWAEVLRVLKPGGHLVAFSGTRTYHRMAVAIEDAGFEIRDQLAWVYGSGFPKSLDVSKAIDKAAGAEREVIGRNPNARDSGGDRANGWDRPWQDDPNAGAKVITAPASEAAQQWQGWGTALKPSWEPICLARKPLIDTVAQNVLTHGTGALNIDGCRIGTGGEELRVGTGAIPCRHDEQEPRSKPVAVPEPSTQGRWPANLCHDGSDEVLAGFPETTSGELSPHHKRGEQVNTYGKSNGAPPSREFGGDSGSAARFFYCAKAATEERGEGNNHPTVKPIALMRWLCRLVTPKGGTILDPFSGSGSTLIAADAEQFNAIGCELSPEYAAIAEKRIRDAAGMFADVKVAA